MAFCLLPHFTDVGSLLANHVRVFPVRDVNLESDTVGFGIQVIENKFPCLLDVGG